MNFLYLDSSILVSIALDDPLRGKQALEHIQQFDLAGTSLLSLVECQSGISFQLSQSPSLLVSAEQNINRLFETVEMINLNQQITHRARSLVKQYRVLLGLRSADAIHLACANEVRVNLENDPTFRIQYLTSDHRQHQAFTAEGYTGLYIS